MNICEKEKELLDMLGSKNPDKLIEAAYYISFVEFEHEKLIELLNSDNQFYKQVALLKLETLKNNQEAEILINNLVDNETKVRDIAAQKIKRFIFDENLRKYFQDQKFVEVFKRGIIDINPNVCRNIIDSLFYYKYKEEFFSEITDNVRAYINELNKHRAQADHLYHKNVFKVYWSIETMAFLTNCGGLDISGFENDILDIIVSLYKKEEYTLREKVAMLSCSLTKYNIFNANMLKEIIEILKNDSNFYVRAVFK